MRLITLTTDFGLRDSYVAEMKGVILSICPDARVVDISHEIPRHDVRHAAFVLLCAYKRFPPGTVHVVVVDPGVGTSRRAVVLKTRRYLFVGPDNGVLMLAAEDDGLLRAFEIRNPLVMRPRVSNTFHGRDIFAPAAAYLALGVPPEFVGPELPLSSLVRIATPRARREGEWIRAEVLHVDHFGNVILNVPDEMLPPKARSLEVELPEGERVSLPLLRAYGEAEEGSLLALIDSAGYLELAVNKGNAAERLGLAPGDKIRIRVGAEG